VNGFAKRTFDSMLLHTREQFVHGGSVNVDHHADPKDEYGAKVRIMRPKAGGSNRHAKLILNFASTQSGNGKRPAVQVSRYPPFLKQKIEQRGPERTTDMRPSLTPVHAAICEAPPQRPSRFDVNSESLKHF